jgi:transposase-like protein
MIPPDITSQEGISPMAQNRIQFQKGLSLPDFLRDYGTEDQCVQAVEQMRWPEGFICPACGSSRHGVVWHAKVKTFQCKDCHVQTTLTSGTIFHATRLPLTKWFQAMYLMTQSKNNISALELTRFLGVCYRTAWRTKHKLMQVMYEREQQTVLSGRVEIDDAYLGGKQSGKAGRGSENKIPFVAAVQTNDEGHPIRAVFSPVKSFNYAEIAVWACDSLSDSAMVISDGLSCFNAVVASGCVHYPQVVGKGRKSTEMGCFYWVNTVLSNIKTAIEGTYHSFDFAKYIKRYLAEVQYRFNRRFDLRSMLPRLLFAGVKTGKRTEAWLRCNEG